MLTVQFSEDSLATQFVEEYIQKIQFVPQMERWLFNDGSKWLFDSYGQIEAWVLHVCRKNSIECPDLEYGRQMVSVQMVRNVKTLAGFDHRMTITKAKAQQLIKNEEFSFGE